MLTNNRTQILFQYKWLCLTEKSGSYVVTLTGLKYIHTVVLLSLLMAAFKQRHAVGLWPKKLNNCWGILEKSLFTHRRKTQKRAVPWMVVLLYVVLGTTAHICSGRVNQHNAWLAWPDGREETECSRMSLICWANYFAPGRIASLLLRPLLVGASSTCSPQYQQMTVLRWTNENLAEVLPCCSGGEGKT